MPRENHEHSAPNAAEFRELKHVVETHGEVLGGTGKDPGVVGFMDKMGDTIYGDDDGLRIRVIRLESWRVEVKELIAERKGSIRMASFIGTLVGGSIVAIIVAIAEFILKHL